MYIDTHTHLYLENFDEDREAVVARALEQKVDKLFMPNVDLETIDSLLKLHEANPNNCYPMHGLHPCSVRDDFKNVLKEIRSAFDAYEFVAVGEIGIDFYWDTTFAEEQIEAFKMQIEWAKELHLPFVIHSRSALDLTIKIVSQSSCNSNSCIFHCFDGTVEQANKIIDMGMKLGIGGVVTHKKSKLVEVVRQIDLRNIVLETDSPYLAPSPHRGQRNESSYIPIIAKRIADIKSCSIVEVAEITTRNAEQLFKI